MDTVDQRDRHEDNGQYIGADVPAAKLEDPNFDLPIAPFDPTMNFVCFALIKKPAKVGSILLSQRSTDVMSNPVGVVLGAGPDCKWAKRGQRIILQIGNQGEPLGIGRCIYSAVDSIDRDRDEYYMVNEDRIYAVVKPESYEGSANGVSLKPQEG
jgi:hypothetical protein